MRAGRSLGLVDHIYESAFDPFFWPFVLAGWPVDAGNQVSGGAVSERSTVPDAVTGSSEERREAGADAFSVTYFQQLQHHIRRALRLHVRNAAENNRYTAVVNAMERLRFGVALIDEQFHIHYATKTFVAISERWGTAAVAGSRLTSGVKHEDERLRKFLQDRPPPEAEQESFSCLPMFLECEGGGVWLLAMPLNVPLSMSGRSMFAVYVVPPLSERSFPESLLRSAFGFTNAEARLAKRIVCGEALDAIAEEQGVSINTLRTQLRALFQKTASSRQPELVARLLQHPLAVVEEPEPPAESDVDTLLVPRREIQLTLRDGRRVCVADYGEPRAFPLLFCHSEWGSRYERHPDAMNLLAAGWRLLVPDRPGIGFSDPYPESDMRFWAEDCVQILDHLQLPQVAMMGYRRGCLFALAAAASLPQRIVSLTLVSPPPWYGDLFSGGELKCAQNFLAELAGEVPALALTLSRAFYRGALCEFERFIEAVAATPKEQQLLLSPAYRKVQQECLRERLRQNTARAAVWEWGLTRRGLPFSLSAVTMPVTVFRGEFDRMDAPVRTDVAEVGFADFRLHCVAGRGHALIYTYWKEILTEMAKCRD